ncbi:hypothetical protein BGI41_00730 [Methanobrevibacter sp. 87.7]|uniref:hypothetical protein n=1 Tax=Methanobrevibacter sp. 87.7 TaxID=387957 RepID=UPI000B504CDA|nr:hypothetical protein [Methanobrevibacter sp. 87.7]OWT33759.1 hypothetical protein BGI41_00730 [Methanobrevibacter sp. 87.7]
MIIDCINGIIDILQNNNETSEVNEIISELCLIIKSEIKKTFPETNVLIITNNEKPEIEIFSKRIFNINFCVKIKIDPQSNGFLTYIAHDWTKFKDTTKFVGDEIVRLLADNIEDIPHGYTKLSNYYGTSCWDDITEVYIISKFHNIISNIEEDIIIDEIDNLINIYTELLYSYTNFNNIDIMKDIEKIFKLYPIEKDDFIESKLSYELITYMKYDLIEILTYVFNDIPEDLRLSIYNANNEYTMTPELSKDLNQLSTSIFYKNGLILGITFECDTRNIKFYISQDIDRINNANESNKIGQALISALKRENTECEFKNISEPETMEIKKLSKTYDIYRFHWICSKTYSFDKLNQKKLINAFIGFNKVYDSLIQYYNYLRGTYDFYEIENTQKS